MTSTIAHPDLRALVRDVPDFPSPGILFRDITPLLASPEAFARAIAEMAAPWKGTASRPIKILGIEARGFMFGAALARELSVGFVPVRKTGKLPRETVRASYGLEYGIDTLEIHRDACSEGERVLVVDDVLATGGTAEAACRLAESLGAEILGISIFIELAALGGRARVEPRPVRSVLVL
ncbi:MAG: adenine phosphoribosyltransferase [Acidobacteriota bacterium]